MLKKNALIMTGLLTLNVASSHAQQLLNKSLVPSPYSNLKTLNGYQPSVLASEADAKKLYDSMPTSVFKGSSGCFQRAESWTYDMNRQQGVQAMKVFLFFTYRYQREFNYEWYYHVAPLIPVKMMDGSIQEMVFDPTFTSTPSWNANHKDQYDNKPISISQWQKYFIFPNVECPLVDDISQVDDYQERYYCYIMKAPMYTYVPANFDDDKAAYQDLTHPAEWTFFNRDTGVRSGWRKGDLINMKQGWNATHPELDTDHL